MIPFRKIPMRVAALGALLTPLTGVAAFPSAGCTRGAEGKRMSTFRLEGRTGSIVSLYRIPAGATEADKARFVPVAQARAGEEIALEPGRYFVANACSGHAFEQSSSPTSLALSSVRFLPRREILPDDNGPVDGEKHVVHTSCLDPLEGRPQTWDNLLELSFLPGRHTFELAGAPVEVEFGERPSEKSIELFPLTVSLEGDASGTRYFVLPEDQAARPDAALVSVPVGGTTWLRPGVYALEINGSRRRAAVEAGMRTRVPLGVLRIDSPPQYPAAQRARLGGQPIFAYINGGVLLNLNKNYVVFPGEYQVSIEGSELSETFVVQAGQTNLVKTQGAIIDGPPCSDGTSCRATPVITVHKEQRPYSLMNVAPGMPFLVLEGKYEYGVEGMRGLLRSLRASGESATQERLGRLRLKWEVRHASSRTRTDLVRLEARGDDTFGRSLDLLFAKPEEVYLPAGSYFLTYFVGDPQQERSKTRVDFTLAQGQTRELVVPLFTDKLTAKPEERGRSSAPSPAAKGDGGALPSALVPLRK